MLRAVVHERPFYISHFAYCDYVQNKNQNSEYPLRKVEQNGVVRDFPEQVYHDCRHQDKNHNRHHQCHKHRHKYREVPRGLCPKFFRQPCLKSTRLAGFSLIVRISLEHVCRVQQRPHPDDERAHKGNDAPDYGKPRPATHFADRLRLYMYSAVRNAHSHGHPRLAAHHHAFHYSLPAHLCGTGVFKKNPA